LVEVPIEKLKLRDNKQLISPPTVVSPLYQCATAVTIVNFVPNALLDVQVDGGNVIVGVAGGFPMPNGITLHLPSPLVSGQAVHARQKSASATSDWSDPVTVSDHTVDYPTGPPRPEIDPAPVYKCGSRTGVNNLLVGCNVWITADGVEVGRVDGSSKHQGVNVNPDYDLNQKVRAWAEICKDPSPPSQQYITQNPLNPLPAPNIEPVYDGGQQIAINGLVNGARFKLSRGGVDQGTWRTWGVRHFVTLAPPFAAGETLSVIQMMCPGDGPSPPGEATVQPCSTLPAPGVGPIQAGDTHVTLTSFVPDAHIKVFVNLVKVGESGGPVIILSKAVQHGDIVHVVQAVGTCVGSMAQEVKVKCIDPPVSYDPSSLNLYPVGNTEYDGGTTVILGSTYHVKGTVYYPAEDDGTSQPFNERVRKHGQVPIVFMAHGNHSPSDPSHLGYDYFQQQLAKMGIVAVSVFSNETNGPGGGPSNITTRAHLIIASIAHFQSLNSSSDPLFGNKIDFSHIGLMGHSRGGEAVIVVPEIISLPNANINCVISLAPVNNDVSSGKPKGYAFMTILPAMDGDVVDNNGAEFYDQATPDPLKSQVYVNHANHNYFNRQWANDDTDGGLPIMTREDHEKVLSAYGCAFFRSHLLGHKTSGFLLYRELPAGVLTNNVHLSFAIQKAITCDNFEDANGIGINSMGQPNTQSGGLTADEYSFSQSGPGRFNDSFFGNTIGMVAQSKERGAGKFRWKLDKPVSLANREVWIRAADVYDGTHAPSDTTGFELGLETTRGTVLWLDSDDVGGIPVPFDRRAYDLDQWYDTDKTKTMLKTLRFSGRCLQITNKKILFRAILVRMNRSKPRPLAFDDLQII
jgi:dienelactone hydrolase